MMTNRFAYGAKIALCMIAMFLPLLVLPAPFAGDVGRDLVLVTLTIVAGVLWLISILSAGEIRYPVSPILWATGAFVLVWSVSMVLGKAPFYSLFFAEAGAERVVTIAAGLLLMIVTAGVLRSSRSATDEGPGTTTRASAEILLFITIFAGAIAGLLTLYTFIVGPIGFLPAQTFFNAIGTVNGMSLFYGALFAMIVGLLLSPASGEWKSWARGAFTLAAAVLLADLMMIHFRAAWIVLLGATICLFGLLLINISKYRRWDAGATGTGGVLSTSGNIGSGTASGAFGWRQWVALGLVIFAIVMIMASGPLFTTLEIPIEVSPSANATFAVAGHVFREGPLRVFFGSGPATFGLDWARYKDASINQTVFWGVRFNQGQSWATTALPTAGILGFGALLGFFVLLGSLFLRMILSSGAGYGEATPHTGAGDALAVSTFLGWVSLLIAAFLYPANTGLLLFFFFTAGILMAVASVPRLPVVETKEPAGQDPETDALMNDAATSAQAHRRGGFWDIQDRHIWFQTPGMVFASSLGIIFFLALGIAGLYGEVSQARAVYAAYRGINAFGEGRIDDAISLLEQAVQYEPRNFHSVQILTQMRIEKMRLLIQRAAGGESVQQEFQSAVSLAIQDSQRLTAMHPEDPVLWRVQGSLYEAVIPFIQGSERFAAAAYQRATELEPLNPTAYVDWGRAGLVFTDRIAVAANQAQGKDREDLLKARQENLEQITTIFQRAIQTKQDFAPAHFLLAQTAMRLGNIDAAIQSVENAKLAAPFDIGVAFQLGLLYYQKDNLGRAQQEFERAITMNENYANARYFLGLIHDRKKDPARALEEFMRIGETNPDNQEIQRIIANIKAGKQALDGIVPPAPPPQQRTEVPIREQERAR